MRTYTQDELNKILDDHRKWLRGEGGTRATLSRANLSGADLQNAKLTIFSIVPDEGSFIAWKKVRSGHIFYILQLKIPADAKRVNSTGRKCRTNKADVLAAFTTDGLPTTETMFQSSYDPTFTYRVGETIEVPDFDSDIRQECTKGIHFFITRKEAVDY